MDDVLQLNPSVLDDPNLDLIAKNADPFETLKLGQILMAVALQSDKAEYYVGVLQSKFSPATQNELVTIIGAVMDRLKGEEESAEMDIQDDQMSPKPAFDFNEAYTFYNSTRYIYMY